MRSLQVSTSREGKESSGQVPTGHNKIRQNWSGQHQNNLGFDIIVINLHEISKILKSFKSFFGFMNLCFDVFGFVAAMQKFCACFLINHDSITYFIKKRELFHFFSFILLIPLKQITSWC